MADKSPFPKNWAVICLINLFLASVIGVFMRYKINYPLPLFNQSNLLHAHSNLVFQGWVTFIFFCSFVRFILPQQLRSRKSYMWQFILMQVTALGMMVAFSLQGYSILSVSLLTLSLLTFYWFSVVFIKDVCHPEVPKVVRNFAIAGVVSSVISSVAIYAMAYFTLVAPSTPIITRGSVYFHLHFLYNGWFSFAVLALFFQWLHNNHIKPSLKKEKWIFLLLIIGLIPGYNLSLMGYYNDIRVHIFSWFAIITQVIAVVLLSIHILKHRSEIMQKLSPIIVWLWGIAYLSFLVKTILQVLSLHPDLAIVAFSLRPLVIGYLHMIFICFVSFFMFGYLIFHRNFNYANSGITKIGLIGFILFSLINEIALFLQAAGYYFQIHFPTIPKNLYYITIGMSVTLLFFLLGQFKKKEELKDPIKEVDIKGPTYLK